MSRAGSYLDSLDVGRKQRTVPHCCGERCMRAIPAARFPLAIARVMPCGDFFSDELGRRT
jgi:hypothetical protein